MARTVWIPKAGPPEVLELRTGPDPTPRAGEVTIRVRAAGVNFADVSARLGFYPDAPPFPCVVGYEVSGTVDAVGPGVTDLRPGQRVAALTRFGGYADLLAVPAPPPLHAVQTNGWPESVTVFGPTAPGAPSIQSFSTVLVAVRLVNAEGMNGALP